MTVIMSPTTDITSRIDVGVVSESTAPTSKRLFMSLVPLDMPTARAGDASVGWAYHGNQNANHRRKQLNSASKMTSSPLLVSGQPFRVLQTNPSARTLSHGHSAAGFAGKSLSLMCNGLPINPISLLIGFSLCRSCDNRPQVGTFISITARHGRPQPNITAQPACRFLHLSQRHGDGHTGIPLAILAKHFCRFVQSSPWQCQRAIDGSMSLRGDIESPVLSARERGSANHNPEIKASGLAWFLDFGRVNQFSFECAGEVSGLSSSPIIDIRASVRTTNKLTHTLSARWTALFLRKQLCGNRVRLTEQGRQKRQGISFSARRKQFEFIRKSNLCCHTMSIAKKTPRRKRSRASAGLSALKRRAETTLGSPTQTPFVLAQDWRLKDTRP